jgi:hypothetical protein
VAGVQGCLDLLELQGVHQATQRDRALANGGRRGRHGDA